MQSHAHHAADMHIDTEHVHRCTDTEHTCEQLLMSGLNIFESRQENDCPVISGLQQECERRVFAERLVVNRHEHLQLAHMVLLLTNDLFQAFLKGPNLRWWYICYLHLHEPRRSSRQLHGHERLDEGLEGEAAWPLCGNEER